MPNIYYMIRSYAAIFLVVEAILLMLVTIDAPASSLLYLSIMSVIMIAIVGLGGACIFYSFFKSKKNKLSSIESKIGAGLLSIFGFLVLRLMSHLALVQIVSMSKLASQVSGVTQVALILTFFYIQYDILRNLKK